MTKSTKSCGWAPDVSDRREHIYDAVRPKLKLPPTVDLRRGCFVVEDQGALGSCTVQALAGHLEFLDNREDNNYMDLSRLFIPKRNRFKKFKEYDEERLGIILLSLICDPKRKQYIYYNERLLEGTVKSDSGAAIRDGIKTLAKTGVCAESSWPYVINRFADKPPSMCYSQTLKHRIVSYHHLTTINEMLICLSDGYSFVFGFTVHESVESPQVARTGIAPMPGKPERVLGGHAVVAVGFNQKDKRFLVRNSWGAKWGRRGYFTMPFAYLESLAQDFWTIRK